MTNELLKEIVKKNNAHLSEGRVEGAIIMGFVMLIIILLI